MAVINILKERLKGIFAWGLDLIAMKNLSVITIIEG